MVGKANSLPIGFKPHPTEGGSYAVLQARTKPLAGGITGPSGQATSMVLLDECDAPVKLMSKHGNVAHEALLLPPSIQLLV